MVRGDNQEHFLDYGYSKQNSKILHFHYKKGISSSFSRTFFNRRRVQYESGAFQGNTFSSVFFFLPSTTERIEDINRHMGSVNLSPIDILEKNFDAEDVSFDQSKLDFECEEKQKISRTVVKMLKQVIDISNANLVKNSDGLLSKKNVDFDVEWIGKDRKRLPDNRYKMSY